MEKWEAAQDYFVSLRSNEEDGMNGSVAETRDILSLKASGDMFTSAKGAPVMITMDHIVLKLMMDRYHK